MGDGLGRQPHVTPVHRARDAEVDDARDKPAIGALDEDVRRLQVAVQDAGIVRNRLKIEASVTNAQAYLAIPDFSAYLWDFPTACRCRTRFAA